MRLVPKLAVLLLIIMLIAGVVYFKSPHNPALQPQALTNQTNFSLGTFKGDFPCADCSKLTISLTLAGSSSNGGTYTMDSNYEGKGDTKTNGNWAIVRGGKTDPEAVIYQLDPGTQNTQYFLRVDNNHLQMLDSYKNKISSPFNSTLTRL